MWLRGERERENIAPNEQISLIAVIVNLELRCSIFLEMQMNVLIFFIIDGGPAVVSSAGHGNN